MIRCDRYTARMWASLTRAPSQEEVAAALPEGHDLHVTHGGTTYSARLWKDGKEVAVYRSPRLVGAIHAAVRL